MFCATAWRQRYSTRGVDIRKSAVGLINLVENPAVGEVDFVGLLPVANDLGQSEQFHFGEAVGVFFRDGFGARAVIMPGDDFLAFVAVEMFQVGLGDGFGAVFFGYFIHYAHRRLRENARGWHDDVELVFAEFIAGEQDLIFPIDQNVADAALDEGGGGAARPGVEHGDVLVEAANEILRPGFVAAGTAPGATPVGQGIPAGAAGGLGIRGDDGDARFDEVIPVFDPLWVALAHQENDGGSVRGAVVGQARLPVLRKQLRLFGDGVDVVGHRQCDDIRVES